MASNTSTPESQPQPRYHLGYTVGFWGLYGVGCVAAQYYVRPNIYAHWPAWVLVLLYVMVASLTATGFTLVRYRLRSIPNHGRWTLALWAIIFAASFALWIWWGPVLIGLGAAAGLCLDRWVPWPEPDSFTDQD